MQCTCLGLNCLTSELGLPNNLSYFKQHISYTSLALSFIFCEISGNAKESFSSKFYHCFKSDSVILKSDFYPKLPYC